MSDMDTSQTCGRGLAEHSALPESLAELTETVGIILEHHIKALDLTDPSTSQELDAYRQLANAHRDAAAQLRTIAAQMAGYRDLPMGRHHPEAMAAPAAIDAFTTLVSHEQQLASLLEQRLKQDRQMLAEMRAAVGR